MRRPVEGAEERARGDRRVGGAQLAASDAVGDERADSAFVPIPLGDDRAPERRRKRVDLEVRRRPFDGIEKAADVGRRQRAEPVGKRALPASRFGERFEQTFERSILAEVQDLFLAGEIVIQIRRREVGGDGDVAHAGRGEAAGAEHAGRRAENLDAARVGPPAAPGRLAQRFRALPLFRTAVRSSNHGSIFVARASGRQAPADLSGNPYEARAARFYNRLVTSARRYVAAVAAVGVATGLLELVGHTVNGITAAQVLLLVLLLDARFCGTRPALVASIAAAAAFAHYFVVPGGFATEDPNDWAAFMSFIIIAAVGGELASRAERRAAEAQAGRHEIERLYQELQDGVRARQRSGGGAPQRAAQGGAARRADAQPADAADRDQGGGYRADRGRLVERPLRPADRRAARTARR